MNVFVSANQSGESAIEHGEGSGITSTDESVSISYPILKNLEDGDSSGI